MRELLEKPTVLENTTFDMVPAEPSDASAIASLGRKSWAKAFAWSVSPEDAEAYLDEAYTPESWERELVDPAATTFVARSKANPSCILGFVELKEGTSEPCLEPVQGPTIELQRIYVDSDLHSQGVGKVLINTAVAEARQKGFQYIWLGVWEHNKRAIKFYEAAGFSRIGEHDFRIGVEIQTDWIMLKAL